MYNFLSQHDVFRDTSTLHKPYLIERNKIRKNRTQSFAQEFGDDFTNEISKANRRELLHFVGVNHLW